MCTSKTYRCPKCKSNNIVVSGVITINANETTVHDVMGLDWFYCQDCKFEEKRIAEDTEGMTDIEKLGDMIHSQLEREWMYSDEELNQNK